MDVDMDVVEVVSLVVDDEPAKIVASIGYEP